MSSKRVLVVASGHPDFSKGGSEVAARETVLELNRRDGWDAWLLASNRHVGLQHTGTLFSLVGQNGRELLLHSTTQHFLFNLNDPERVAHEFSELLHSIKPDVVHFHHYVHTGIELLRFARRALPQATILLTLHEYLAICNRDGQMVKKDGQLCYRSSPGECHLCFPSHTPQDFFLRRSYILSFFELVDHFVAPSAFLRDRYVDWGLPPERISVVENGQPEGNVAEEPSHGEASIPARFGYFGQITPFKGVDLLLDAFSLLQPQVRENATLSIFGGGQNLHGEEFAQRMDTMLRTNGPQTKYYGPYEPPDMPRLIRDIDWVIVPSLWWENSPLVIQEAFKHRRPVICSDIGGMAEKVRHGVNGLHFQARSPRALADVMTSVIAQPTLWSRLRDGIVPPPSIRQTVDELIGLYETEGPTKRDEPQNAHLPSPPSTSVTQTP